ncbi:MAG: cupin domain-containing protein [Pseudomonadales bacterium]|jgi:ribosomal protein L16 Arg81 hydroxylase
MASLPPWVSNPLGYLLGDISPSKFFSDYHEQKALRCKPSDTQHFQSLLNEHRLDTIIAETELPPESLEMARTNPPLSRDQFTFQNGEIDRGAVVRHFQQGATLILTQLQLADPKLAELCRALEYEFSAHVQTNIYFTPPGYQGFRTHFDDHDVFVIQVSGQKDWTLYERPVNNPYRGERFQSSKHPAGEVADKFTLTAGECLYVPRGLMHDAVASGSEPSLHITVGVIVKSWADLMLEAMSEVALQEPSFRRSLPPGFAKIDFDRSQAEEHFQSLVSAFADSAQLDGAFNAFVGNFIRSQPALVSGALSHAATHSLAEHNYRVRPNSLARTFIDDSSGELIVVCPGGDIRFAPDAEEKIDSILAGQLFNAEFLEGLTDSSADIINKLLAFGIVQVDTDSPAH